MPPLSSCTLCNIVSPHADYLRGEAAEEAELVQVGSESSLGLHSTSLVEPNNEAVSTRQQLLMALSLLKHLAHSGPSACEAMVSAGVMNSVTRYSTIALRAIALYFTVCQVVDACGY